MPGRLVERVTTASKLVAGLHPVTPRLIAQLYKSIVTTGTLHETNSLTAEVVKTLENAYRDIRIAFAAEVVRFCDSRDIDFHDVRRQVNERLGQTDSASSDPSAVPTGGLLIPTIGVGGHCLPKDGILLCWRRLQRVRDTAASLFLESRRINDESPGAAIRLAERAFGSLAGRRIALLGTAYRPDSEDTRNSPTLALASEMQRRRMEVVLHDPHVRPGDQNLLRTGLDSYFTRDINEALSAADIVMLCVAHRAYAEDWDDIRRAARAATGVFDGCNLFPRESARAGAERDTSYPGIGRGRRSADRDLVHAVVADFHTVERGVANELAELIDLFNAEYVRDDFNRVDYADVQRLAATCSTGCEIVRPGFIDAALGRPFSSRLATCARRAAVTRSFVAGVPS
jgi:UDP-N-acetyl-D-mannosaminuronic acid dehydrogenase